MIKRRCCCISARGCELGRMISWAGWAWSSSRIAFRLMQLFSLSQGLMAQKQHYLTGQAASGWQNLLSSELKIWLKDTGLQWQCWYKIVLACSCATVHTAEQFGPDCLWPCCQTCSGAQVRATGTDHWRLLCALKGSISSVKIRKWSLLRVLKSERKSPYILTSSKRQGLLLSWSFLVVIF